METVNKQIYVARPSYDCDYIYNVYNEDEKYYITSSGKIPKSIVDSNKSWHKNYYFSSQKKENDWYDQQKKAGK